MGYMVKNRRIQAGDSSIVAPKGPTAHRPFDPVPGQIRYNEDLCKFEYYTGSGYRIIATEGKTNLTVDTFLADGSSAWFSGLSYNVENASDVLVFVGHLYQIPNESYTVDGTDTIYFAEVVPPGVNVSVIHNLGTTTTAGCAIGPGPGAIGPGVPF